MAEMKRNAKYVEGHEPWTAEGLKETTFYARLRAEKKKGDTDGPAHRAVAKALEIAARTIVPDTVEASASEEPTSDVEVIVAPEEPEGAEVPAPAALEPTSDVEAAAVPAIPEADHKPVAPAASESTKGTTSASPSAPPSSAVPGATVFVSFRCPVEVHDRMREMAHKRRTKLQGIVAAAVEAYLSQNGF